jgi:hypothetical protein
MFVLCYEGKLVRAALILFTLLAALRGFLCFHNEGVQDKSQFAFRDIVSMRVTILMNRCIQFVCPVPVQRSFVQSLRILLIPSVSKNTLPSLMSPGDCCDPLESCRFVYSPGSDLPSPLGLAVAASTASTQDLGY